MTGINGPFMGDPARVNYVRARIIVDKIPVLAHSMRADGFPEFADSIEKQAFRQGWPIYDFLFFKEDDLTKMLRFHVFRLRAGAIDVTDA